MRNTIKNKLSAVVLRVLPGVRAHNIPAAADIDSIVKPMGEMMERLREAAKQHSARAKAQDEAATALWRDAEASQSKALRAERLAEKIYNFVG